MNIDELIEELSKLRRKDNEIGKKDVYFHKDCKKNIIDSITEWKDNVELSSDTLVPFDNIK